MNLFSMLPPLALAANLSVAAWQSDWLDRVRAVLNEQWDPMGHHRTYWPDDEDEYDEIRDLLAILIGAGASDAMLGSTSSAREAGVVLQHSPSSWNQLD